MSTWSPVQAQFNTFNLLHSFYETNSEGTSPQAGLILSGDTLYGTTWQGGSAGFGTIFRISLDGSGFTNLHTFTDGADGANPQGSLILAGNILYGTAQGGGSWGNGTVFSINTDGTVFTNLYSFTGGGDGASPQGTLTLSASNLYGTAFTGGIAGNGVLFALNTNGTGFTNLHIFSATLSGTNSDGANPDGGLFLSAETLYGAAYAGGSANQGTVFRVNTDGSDFTNLHNFTATSVFSPVTNSDGANPVAGVILSNNTLYGTAQIGGSAGWGTVFSVNTDGSDFTNLHSFGGKLGFNSRVTNTDGAYPNGGLILSDDTLYGAALNGGSTAKGTLFTIHTDGSDFTNLHNFTGSSDGANPYGSLILSGNALYGTASEGGTGNQGTVFALASPEAFIPPILGISSAGNQFVLYWPASATNFILQTTSNLSSPNWATVSNGVPIIGVTLTNVSPGAFFRLQQQ